MGLGGTDECDCVTVCNEVHAAHFSGIEEVDSKLQRLLYTRKRVAVILRAPHVRVQLRHRLMTCVTRHTSHITRHASQQQSPNTAAVKGRGGGLACPRWEPVLLSPAKAKHPKAREETWGCVGVCVCVRVLVCGYSWVCIHACVRARVRAEGDGTRTPVQPSCRYSIKPSPVSRALWHLTC